MKKKYVTSSKDKSDWAKFTKKIGNLYDKDFNLTENNKYNNKILKLDLHGYSLDKSNELVRNFILNAFKDKYRKLLIITGKGSRSNVYNNPYRSEKMSVLKYSVPEYIKNNQKLSEKIIKISEANLKDGGEGAFYIFLKEQKNL